MPEPPDFEQIARRLIAHLPIPQGAEVAVPDGEASDEVAASIVEQLRLVWNARGVADIAKIESLGPVVSGPYGYLKNVEGALRKLDR